MQLSKETLAMLKNYASINTNMLFRKGNVLATMSHEKDIFSKVTVEETFPRQFAVYDLNQLLGTLSLFQDFTLTFNDKSLTIKSGRQTTEYFYTNEENIVAAPDKTLPTGGMVTFELADKDLSAALKAAAVLDAPDMTFAGNGETITLKVWNRTVNRTANNFIVELGETDKKFQYHLKVEKVKMVPDTYTTSINERKFVYFSGAKKKAEYWLAVDPKSTIDND